MRDNFKILLEDDQKIYNKWVKGIAKQEGPSQVITVDDIINRYRNSTSYEAPKNLPYGLDNILNQLGDLVVKCGNIRGSLVQGMKNPVVNNVPHRAKAAKDLHTKITKIQEMIFSCTEELNKIVENPES